MVRRFPDVVSLLLDAIESILGGGQHTGYVTPADLADRLPFVRVRRVSGNRDRFNDFAVVDLDVFAATYPAALDLSEQLADWLCGPPPPIAAFDRAECTSSPVELPWDDSDPPKLRRFGATYTVVSRRRGVF